MKTHTIAIIVAVVTKADTDLNLQLQNKDIQKATKIRVLFRCPLFCAVLYCVANRRQ